MTVALVLLLGVVSQTQDNNYTRFFSGFFSVPVQSMDITFEQTKVKPSPPPGRREQLIEETLRPYRENEGREVSRADLSAQEWEDVLRQVEQRFAAEQSTTALIRLRASAEGTYFEFLNEDDSAPYITYVTPSGSEQKSFRYDHRGKTVVVETFRVSPPIDFRGYWRIPEPQRLIFRTFLGDEYGGLDPEKLRVAAEHCRIGMMAIQIAPGDSVEGLPTLAVSIFPAEGPPVDLAYEMRVLQEDPSILVDMTVDTGSQRVAIENRDFTLVQSLNCHFPMSHSEIHYDTQGKSGEMTIKARHIHPNALVPSELFSFSLPIGYTMIDNTVNPPFVHEALSNQEAASMVVVDRGALTVPAGTPSLSEPTTGKTALDSPASAQGDEAEAGVYRRHRRLAVFACALGGIAVFFAFGWFQRERVARELARPLMRVAMLLVGISSLYLMLEADLPVYVTVPMTVLGSYCLAMGLIGFIARPRSDSSAKQEKAGRRDA